MIPIAEPLADTTAAEAIKQIVTASYEDKTLISGIKPCQKAIIARNTGLLLVLNAETSPMDLITHMPALAENNAMPYIFVPCSDWINGFTCVLIATEPATDELAKILAQSHTY